MDNHREIKTVLEPLLAWDAVLCSDDGGKSPIALVPHSMGFAHRVGHFRKWIRVLVGIYHN